MLKAPLHHGSDPTAAFKAGSAKSPGRTRTQRRERYRHSCLLCSGQLTSPIRSKVQQEAAWRGIPWRRRVSSMSSFGEMVRQLGALRGRVHSDGDGLYPSQHIQAKFHITGGGHHARSAWHLENKDRTSAHDFSPVYLYVSQTKVDMLLSQIPKVGVQSIAAKLKIDLSILGARGRGQRSTHGSTRTRLVESYLQEHAWVGDLDDGAEYVAGTMPLSWGEIEGAVIFAGVRGGTGSR